MSANGHQNEKQRWKNDLCRRKSDKIDGTQANGLNDSELDQSTTTQMHVMRMQSSNVSGYRKI